MSQAEENIQRAINDSLQLGQKMLAVPPSSQAFVGFHLFDHPNVNTQRQKRMAETQATKERLELEEQEKQMAILQQQRDAYRQKAEERHQKELADMRQKDEEAALLMQWLQQRRKKACKNKNS